MFTVSLPIQRSAGEPRDEDRPGPRFSRTDRAVLMHVMLLHDGREIRHRIMIDENVHSSWTYAAIMNGKTACAKSIAAKWYRPTPAAITGELCRDGCFTLPELQNADRVREKAEQARHAEAEREAEERAQSLTEIRERSRRAKTGETEPVEKVGSGEIDKPDSEK